MPRNDALLGTDGLVAVFLGPLRIRSISASDIRSGGFHPSTSISISTSSFAVSRLPFPSDSETSCRSSTTASGLAALGNCTCRTVVPVACTAIQGTCSLRADRCVERGSDRLDETPRGAFTEAEIGHDLHMPRFPAVANVDVCSLDRREVSGSRGAARNAAQSSYRNNRATRYSTLPGPRDFESSAVSLAHIARACLMDVTKASSCKSHTSGLDRLTPRIEGEPRRNVNEISDVCPLAPTWPDIRADDKERSTR